MKQRHSTLGPLRTQGHAFPESVLMVGNGAKTQGIAIVLRIGGSVIASTAQQSSEASVLGMPTTQRAPQSASP